MQNLEAQGNTGAAPRPDQYRIKLGTSSVETNMTPQRGGLVLQSQSSGKSLTDYRGTEPKHCRGAQPRDPRL